MLSWGVHHLEPPEVPQLGQALCARCEDHWCIPAKEGVHVDLAEKGHFLAVRRLSRDALPIRRPQVHQRVVASRGEVRLLSVPSSAPHVGFFWNGADCCDGAIPPGRPVKEDGWKSSVPKRTPTQTSDDTRYKRGFKFIMSGDMT
jgi:hypothetical protein